MLLGGIWLLILDVVFALEYYVSQFQTLHGFRHAPFIQLGWLRWKSVSNVRLVDPRLRSFCTYFVYPQDPIHYTKPANSDVQCRRWFKSCWTPMDRTSHSTIFFKFGRKAPLNLRKMNLILNLSLSLSLSLRRGPWQFWSWLRGLIVIATGIKVFEDANLNKRRRATTGQGIMRMRACYEGILKH